MQIDIRQAQPEEMEQLGEIGAYVFAGAFGDGPRNTISTANRPEWTLCAFVDGVMATSYLAIPFRMRFNGASLPTAGVSAVGTLPEFRRRGLLRKVTEQSFRDMRDRGQPLAALWASQAAIYQRFGYGLASWLQSYRIDQVDELFRSMPTCEALPAITIRRVSVERAAETLKALYIDFVAKRSVYLHRSQVLWQRNTLAPSTTLGPAHIAIAYRGEKPVGYVVYTTRDGQTTHPARGQELNIRDFVWLQVDAYRALWHWLAQHDLIGRIVWPRAPMDDPAPSLMGEPRLLNVHRRDGVWLRVVDVEFALAGRGYAQHGELAIEIIGDDLAPWNNRRYLVTSTPNGTTVAHTQAVDITTNARALASLYAGFATARTLAAIGELSGSDDAIARCDYLFATHFAPHCPDHF